MIVEYEGMCDGGGGTSIYMGRESGRKEERGGGEVYYRVPIFTLV